MMFIRSFLFFLGVLATFLLGWAGIVGIPDAMISGVEPPAGLKRYTGAQLYGRSIYIREGCVYCHSQQPRARGFGADQERFWGRASVPADYMYDRPHLLGTMRTGPDLLNIAARQASEEWHYLHLYNARLAMKESIMPPYPWLFEGDSIVPPNALITPTSEGKALVGYLLSLDRTYDAPRPTK